MKNNPLIVVFLFTQIYLNTLQSQEIWTLTSLQNKNGISEMLSLGKTLYVSTLGEGIFKSEDNSDVWIELNNGIDNKYITAFINKANTLYAASFSNGIFKSTDKGDSWIKLEGLNEKYIFSLGFSGANLLVGTWSGIYYTSDEKNWQKASIKGLRKNEISFSFINSKKGLFAGSGRYIFKSTDDGKTWTTQETNSIFDHQTFFEQKDALMAGSSGDGILVYVNGDNWVKKIPLKSENDLKNVTSIITDSTGLLIASSNTNILNDGEKMINGKTDLRAQKVFYHKGYYYAAAYGGGLWRLDLNKKMNEVELRNSFELQTTIYPNPANQFSVIDYTISHKAKVSLELFYANGRLFRRLIHGTQEPGIYQIKMADLNLPSGTYFMRVVADKQTQVKRMIVINN